MWGGWRAPAELIPADPWWRLDSSGTSYGTASQAGATITAGSSVFTDPDDVGKVLRFADGTLAIIEAITSGTVATADREQEVASQAVTAYDAALGIA